MIFLLGIYLVVGSVSALTNFVKWVTPVFFILFLPFMIVHAFIYGDAKKKEQAITILKGSFVLTLGYFALVGLIMLYQAF
ncbi:MAG: hypothetical protein GZ087_03385 [Flavobacterium sp.]|nr:hypothetical protein [Flavobacterium sp.]